MKIVGSDTCDIEIKIQYSKLKKEEGDAIDRKKS